MADINQFWAQSQDGRAMVQMLCRRGMSDRRGHSRGAGDVEFVRAICEWLVSTKLKAMIQDNIARGATLKQAQLAADNAIAGVRSSAENISEGNTESSAMSVIDYCFSNYKRAGQAEYVKAMAWFAGEMRKRALDD